MLCPGAVQLRDAGESSSMLVQGSGVSNAGGLRDSDNNRHTSSENLRMIIIITFVFQGHKTYVVHMLI
jgi:hypothetical protein